MHKTTTIIVDTRERTPWTFEGQAGINLERAKLDSGDYSIKGLESRVSIERKSLDDFLNTVLRDRQRFNRELDRLRSFDFRCVIIETNVGEIYSRSVSKRIHSEAVMGLIAEVSVAQCVPVYLGGSRPESQLLAGALLKMADRKFRLADCAG